MELGFVTDEISLDVQEAVEIGVSWGITRYELRVVGQNRIPDIDESAIVTIERLIDQHGIQITALSPGTFKGTIHDNDTIEREISEVLPKTFEIANRLNCEMVIVFGFKRSENDETSDEQRVIDKFGTVAGLAQTNGSLVAVENEPGFWCDSGVNTAKLLAAVNSPALRANWDPGNSVGTSEPPFPEGYNAIKDWIANVHIKDTIKGALVECVPVGEGVVDWPGQIGAILQDRPVGHMTIETHCLPLIKKSLQNLKTVREMMAKTND